MAAKWKGLALRAVTADLELRSRDVVVNMTAFVEFHQDEGHDETNRSPF